MIKHIPIQHLALNKPLIQDYLFKKESIQPLVNMFFEKENIPSIIQQKQQQDIDRHTLVSALEKQYQAANINIPKQMHQLTDSNCFTVTTGHQLSIIGGPLFLMYKITEAINLADELSKAHPEHQFLPMFWMASEDHDFKEIQSVDVLGETFTWNTNQTGAVGRFLVDEALIAELQKLSEKLVDKPFGKEITHALQNAYILGTTLSQSTRRFIHHLFNDTPLIIIDGDDAALKTLAKDIFELEMKEQIGFNTVNSTNAYLSANAYHQQAFAREYNLFELGNNFRNRLETTNSDLLKTPERISPNALIRPIYQEKILPNIITIGGGGELAYWLQLKSAFDKMGVVFPMLKLRNSVLNIDATTWKRMQKLDISVEDLFKTADELKILFVSKNVSENNSLSADITAVQEIFKNIESKVEAIDKSLVAKVKAEQARIENAISDLEKRMEKSQKQAFETSLQQIEKLKDKLFPKGTIQERADSFLSFYAIYGNNFLTNIKATIQPFNTSVSVRIDE
jgi:bacillithiol biosynthesis cysteine-adding enzyme BshC